MDRGCLKSPKSSDYTDYDNLEHVITYMTYTVLIGTMYITLYQSTSVYTRITVE
jgi:hypothetical protein